MVTVFAISLACAEREQALEAGGDCIEVCANAATGAILPKLTCLCRRSRTVDAGSLDAGADASPGE
jgi:hypothetical protein